MNHPSFVMPVLAVILWLHCLTLAVHPFLIATTPTKNIGTRTRFQNQEKYHTSSKISKQQQQTLFHNRRPYAWASIVRISNIEHDLNTSARSNSGRRRKSCKRNRPSNVRVIHTLQEYRAAVTTEYDNIVVVNFFASWCKKCQRIKPLFYYLAKQNPSLIFVEVPVSSRNRDLQSDLSLRGVPYGHIYVPKIGLAEELPLFRNVFPIFEKLLLTYIE
mmetsp:Transcript_21932/g.27134  ORF Transcript_21932/g.27134 Transcript_21932/m.27134 type:complete len:217 (+) Transcript_21932:109-759(+)